MRATYMQFCCSIITRRKKKIGMPIINKVNVSFKYSDQIYYDFLIKLEHHLKTNICHHFGLPKIGICGAQVHMQILLADHN